MESFLGSVFRFRIAGLGLQILQQLAGINTVMYYTPAILELAGFRDKRSALLIAMAPAAGRVLGACSNIPSLFKIFNPTGSGCNPNLGGRSLMHLHSDDACMLFMTWDWVVLIAFTAPTHVTHTSAMLFSSPL